MKIRMALTSNDVLGHTCRLSIGVGVINEQCTNRTEEL